MVCFKMIVSVLMVWLPVLALVYLTFGKVKGEPELPPKALWIFSLLEKTFDQKEVKENEVP